MALATEWDKCGVSGRRMWCRVRCKEKGGRGRFCVCKIYFLEGFSGLALLLWFAWEERGVGL